MVLYLLLVMPMYVNVVCLCPVVKSFRSSAGVHGKGLVRVIEKSELRAESTVLRDLDFHAGDKLTLEYDYGETSYHIIINFLRIIFPYLRINYILCAAGTRLEYCFSNWFQCCRVLQSSLSSLV